MRPASRSGYGTAAVSVAGSLRTRRLALAGVLGSPDLPRACGSYVVRTRHDGGNERR